MTTIKRSRCASCRRTFDHRAPDRLLCRHCRRVLEGHLRLDEELLVRVARER